jgi:hypothetical protein
VPLPATETAHAESLYAARFPGYAAPDLSAYRFYRFRTDRLKAFDEPCLGRGSSSLRVSTQDDT